jgi:endonuclease YncB( thermonuclease family)
MTSGYQSAIVAEARQRYRDLLEAITQIYITKDRAREAEDYNMDASGFYPLARQSLVSTSDDLVLFREFIDANRTKLESYDYYNERADEIDAQLNMLEMLIITPSITTTEAVVGQFSGTVTAVDDCDTLAIKQDIEGMMPERIVRIAGIDSPEKGTSRGKAALEAATSRWLGRQVTVYVDAHSPYEVYGRILGTVFDGDVNFALWALTNCWADPLTKFGKNKFVDPNEIKLAAEKCLMSGWPPDGIIKIFSSPTHAVVHLIDSNGSVVRNEDITPCEIRTKAGDYMIVLSAEGCTSIRDEVTVDGNVTKQLPPYTLPKLGAGLGTVRINVIPSNVRAIVSLDGDPVGIAPFSVDYPIGTDIGVSIDADGYESIDDIVKPVLGEIVNKKYELAKTN